jgi:hypothetical protein
LEIRGFQKMPLFNGLKKSALKTDSIEHI